MLLLVFTLLIGACLAVVLAALATSLLSPAAWSEFGKPLAEMFNRADRAGLEATPWFLASIAVSLLLGLMLFLRLRRISRTIRDGRPFSTSNITDVRVIALLLALEGMVSLTRDVMIAVLKKTGGEIDIEIGTLLSIFILLVLAEVFREGARLTEQEEMTA